MNNNDIKMLPDRLNRMPVVYNGMTVRELLLMAGFGAIIGGLLGIILFIVFGRWVLIPSAIVFIPLPTIFLAGKKISKLKRGKPETWFARYIDLFFAKRGFNGNKLIFNDQQFIVRRKNKKVKK